jgi:DNA-binding protein H-NS
MDVASLFDLRKQVEDALSGQRAKLEKQLAAIGGSVASSGKRRGSGIRGRKVAPKYRSPDGETWAGRGARPRWLVAALKEGKKLESFLIEKTAAKGRKKRKSKG